MASVLRSLAMAALMPLLGRCFNMSEYSRCVGQGVTQSPDGSHAASLVWCYPKEKEAISNTYGVGIDIDFVGLRLNSGWNSAPDTSDRDGQFGDPHQCPEGRTVINTCRAVNPDSWPSVGVFNVNGGTNADSVVIEKTVLLFRAMDFFMASGKTEKLEFTGDTGRRRRTQTSAPSGPGADGSGRLRRLAESDPTVARTTNAPPSRGSDPTVAQTTNARPTRGSDPTVARTTNASAPPSRGPGSDVGLSCRTCPACLWEGACKRGSVADCKEAKGEWCGSDESKGPATCRNCNMCLSDGECKRVPQAKCEGADTEWCGLVGVATRPPKATCDECPGCLWQGMCRTVTHPNAVALCEKNRGLWCGGTTDDASSRQVVWSGLPAERYAADDANVTKLSFVHESDNAVVTLYFELADAVHVDSRNRHRRGQRERRYSVAAPNGVKWGLEVSPRSADPITRVVLSTSFLTQLREYCRDSECPRPYEAPSKAGNSVLEHHGAFLAWDADVSINGAAASVVAATTEELQGIVGASHTSIQFTFDVGSPIQELTWDPVVGVGGLVEDPQLTDPETREGTFPPSDASCAVPWHGTALLVWLGAMHLLRSIA